MADDGWRSDALCATDTFKELAKLAGAQRDPSEVFYEVTETDDGKEVRPSKPAHLTYLRRSARFERLARATCAECPVRLDCLLYNLEVENEPHGIVGGHDAQSRLALMDSPKEIKGTCQCGVKLFGAKGAMPKACSANCRGE